VHGVKVQMCIKWLVLVSSSGRCFGEITVSWMWWWLSNTGSGDSYVCVWGGGIGEKWGLE
jgi:hypothetical protein